MTEEELYFRQRQAQQDQENNRLRNQQFNYMVEMGALDPQEEELQRKQAQIDMLRDRGMEGQEGRMVGNTFVAPSFTQYAAQLGNAYMARKGNEETKAGRDKIAAKRADEVRKFAGYGNYSAVDALRKKRDDMGIY
jgi:hypothetical protein